MFRTIAIVICLLCMTFTAFAQADDIFQDTQRLAGQGTESYDPVAGQRWYSLEVSSSYGGLVTPAGLIRVREGETVTLSIRPDRGFHIQKVIIDGRRVSPESIYRFTDIQRDHTAYIEFAPNQR